MTFFRLVLIALAGWQLFPKDAFRPDLHLASGVHAMRALEDSFGLQPLFT